MKISACVITKNEEETIVRNINSYKDSVDEIIVVDTGSTDNTVEVAKSLGATVYYFEWIDDFAAAKNHALEKATGDWIIFMDADEYFDKNTSKTLRTKIEKYNKKPNIQGIVQSSLNIEENNPAKVISKQPSLRIFRNNPKIRYVGKIHEEIKYNNTTIKFTFDTALVIYHTGYATREILNDKLERNLAILLDSPSNDSFMDNFNIGKTYLGLQMPSEALKHLRLIIFDNANSILGQATFPYDFFCLAKLELNEYDDEFDKILDIAELKFPQHPVFVYYRAYKFFIEKQFERSLILIEQAKKMHIAYNNDKEINPLDRNLDKLFTLCSYIYFLKNEDNKAYENLVTALSFNKHNPEAFSKFCLISKKKEPKEVIDILLSLYDINNEEELQFLMLKLITSGLKDVLYYFWKIWHYKYDHKDNSFVITLLAQQQYLECFPHIVELYNQTDKNNSYKNNYESELVFSALLSGNIEYIKTALELTKQANQNILNAFIHPNVYTVDNDDFIDYYNLLLFFITLTNEPLTEMFLEIPNNFSKTNLETIACCLMENGYYETSFKCFNHLLSLEVSNQKKGEIFTTLGKINFKIKDYEDATAYFKDAIEQIGETAEIKEYLNWIKKVQLD